MWCVLWVPSLINALSLPSVCHLYHNDILLDCVITRPYCIVTNSQQYWITGEMLTSDWLVICDPHNSIPPTPPILTFGCVKDAFEPLCCDQSSILGQGDTGSLGANFVIIHLYSAFLKQYRTRFHHIYLYFLDFWCLQKYSSQGLATQAVILPNLANL